MVTKILTITTMTPKTETMILKTAKVILKIDDLLSIQNSNRDIKNNVLLSTENSNCNF